MLLCCDNRFVRLFTQFVHDLLVRHLALLFLSVCSLGGDVSVHTRAWSRDGVNNGASIHLLHTTIT